MITGGNFVTVTVGEGGVFQNHTYPTAEGRKSMRKLSKMIAPGAFHNSAERYDPPKCHPKTREAVLKKIMDWVQGLDAFERRCYFMWLYGPAGAGKSAIAQTIAELCCELKLLAASFFFSRTAMGRNDNSRFIATITYQLCLSIPEIRAYTEDAIDLDPNIFSLSLENQLQRLIIEPLSRLLDNPNYHHHPRLVIIDGLDECTSPFSDQHHVLQILAEKLSVPILFLVASRPEPHIRGLFTTEPMASITTTLALDDSYLPDADIKVFLTAKFNAIKRDHSLRRQLPESWPSVVDIDHLVRKSSGQFIYASTVMKYVESPRHWPTDRLETILGIMPSRGKDVPFADLDSLYTHIFSSVDDTNKVLEVLSVLLLMKASRFIKNPTIIEGLLGLRNGDLGIILIDLHSILDIPAQADVGEIRILHASLGDFLLDQTRSGNYYINQGDAHTNLARHLTRCIPKKVACNNSNISKLPTLSSTIFTVHCTQSHPTAELLDALWSFDVFVFWTLFFSGNSIQGDIWPASQLPDFFGWLKNYGSNKEGQDLYSHYMLGWDQYIQHSLRQLYFGPLEIQYIVFFNLPQFRNHYQMRDVFTWTTFGAEYQSLRNVSVVLENHNGDCRYDFLLAEFFSDHSRSGAFYLDGDKYAGFAMTFTKYLILCATPCSIAQNWEHDLSCLSILLSKASYLKRLTALLNIELMRLIEVQRPDLAQQMADIIKTYYNSSTSKRYKGRHTGPAFGTLKVRKQVPTIETPSGRRKRSRASPGANGMRPWRVLPTPTGGFLPIQGLTSKYIRTNVDPRSLALWDRYQDAAVLAYIPYDKPEVDSLHKVTKIRDLIQSVFNVPTLLVSAPQYIDAGHLVKKPIYPIFIGGISSNQAQVLLDRICWSTPIITFFTAPFTPFVSDFVMTLQNIPLSSTHENELAIAEIVKHVIRTDITLYHFLNNHHDALRNHPTIEEAVEHIADSVRAVGLNTIIAGEPVTLFNIFAAPPSHNPATYESWVLHLRNITYLSRWGAHTAKALFSCDCCKSTDHSESICPFQRIRGFPEPPITANRSRTGVLY